VETCLERFESRFASRACAPLRQFTLPGSDIERSLLISPHHPHEVTEQGFHFAATKPGKGARSTPARRARLPI
jgi:hypothetical protein